MDKNQANKKNLPELIQQKNMKKMVATDCSVFCVCRISCWNVIQLQMLQGWQKFMIDKKLWAVYQNYTTFVNQLTLFGLRPNFEETPRNEGSINGKRNSQVTKSWHNLILKQLVSLDLKFACYNCMVPSVQKLGGLVATHFQKANWLIVELLAGFRVFYWLVVTRAFIQNSKFKLYKFFNFKINIRNT